MPEQAISLTGAVERFPVVTTGVRWPCVREEQGPEPYFRIFPECRRDPRRNDYGSVTQWPPPVDYSLLDLEHPEWGTCAIAYRYDQELFEPDAGR